MAVTIGRIMKEMEAFAPSGLAESWDKVGLFLGSSGQEVKRVLISLGVSEEVVCEGIEKKVDLILTHHPFWLSPPTYLSEETRQGKMVAQLIRNRIGVFSAHTNLDACRGGVNDGLAALLDLKEVKILEPIQEKWQKLVVFVPEEAADKVGQAMGDAGAGKLGNYSHCSFSSEGAGRFLPLDGAAPAFGKVGTLEEVREVRIEALVLKERLSEILSAVRAAHPYEEVAYDVYPLDTPIVSSAGIGRIGCLETPMTLVECVNFIKERLALPGVRFCGVGTEKIQKIALCGGAGMSFWKAATNAGADVFLTGDIRHHDAEEALASGLSLIDGGHYGTEKCVLSILAEKIQKIDSTLEVVISQQEKEIFQFT